MHMSRIEPRMCPNHPDEDMKPFPGNHHFFSPRISRIWTHGFPPMNVLWSCWCYWIPKLINKLIKAGMCGEQRCHVCKCTKHVISTMQQIYCIKKGKKTLFRTHGVMHTSVFVRRASIPQVVVLYGNIRFQPDVTWEIGLVSQTTRNRIWVVQSGTWKQHNYGVKQHASDVWLQGWKGFCRMQTYMGYQGVRW